MEHYACAGECKGVSSEQSVCQAQGCPKYGQFMGKCECGDSSHSMAAAPSQEENKLPEEPVEQNQ